MFYTWSIACAPKVALTSAAASYPGTPQNATPLFSTPALGQAGVTVLTLCEMLHFVLLHIFLDKKDHFSSERIVFAKGGYWGFISCP